MSTQPPKSAQKTSQSTQPSPPAPKSNAPKDANGNPAPPKPKNGGWSVCDGVWVAWVGSDPMATEPTHQGQWRAVGPKSKAESTCTTWIADKFEKTDSTSLAEVNQFKDLLRQHLEETGMDDVFYLDLGTGSARRTVNLIDSHAMLEMEQVKACCKDLATNGDKWQKQNLTWSGKLMQNAVSGAMLTEMLNKCSIGDSGFFSFPQPP
jgi:hypothetical protein